MALPIELRDHPNKSPVTAPNGKPLYHCDKCNEDFVEQPNRAFHEPVWCEKCKGACKPRFRSTVPDQHGVYFDGQCIGYAKRQRYGWVSLIQKVDDSIAQAIKKMCEDKYGGEFKLQNGPYVPPELHHKYWETAGLKEQPEPEPEDEDELIEEDEA